MFTLWWSMLPRRIWNKEYWVWDGLNHIFGYPVPPGRHQDPFFGGLVSPPHVLIRIRIPPSPAILAGKLLGNGLTQHYSALISTDQSAQRWMNWSVLSAWKLNRAEWCWTQLSSTPILQQGLYCPPIIPAELSWALVDFRGRMTILNW